MTEKMTELSYDGQKFEVFEAVPEGEVKGGLIVIEEVWGLTDHIKDVSRRFAKEGYHILSPELLSDLHIKEHADTLMLDLFDPKKRNEAQPRMRQLMAPIQELDFAEKTLAKLRVAFDYLYDQSDVHKWVAVTGFCFGGSYSYALALAEPRLKAAVPFYGHADVSDVEKLKGITCPVQAYYGEQDERLVTGVPEVEKAMREAGVNYNAHIYPSCGHAFFNDSNPFAYNKDAADDAWSRTLALLDEARQ